MSIPTYDQFIEPILRFLAANPAGVPTREVHEATAKALQLTAEQRQEVVPSGSRLTRTAPVGPMTVSSERVCPAVPNAATGS